MSDDTRFALWMADVNDEVEKLLGLSVYDLPDCCYRDWFEDGMSPSAAARKAIRYAKAEADSPF